MGTQLLTMAKRYKCSNGGQAIVVSSLRIVGPSPETATQTEKSIAPAVAIKRKTFNKAPLWRVSLYAFWNGEMDVMLSLELAVLPVTKDPFGLLPSRWNCTMAYRWASKAIC